MKLIITKYFSLIMLITLLVSCEDFLNPEPRTLESRDITFESYDGVEKSINGSYTSLYRTAWYGRDLIANCALRGGNGKKSPLNSGRFLNEYKWANNEGNTIDLYLNAYRTITRASNVILYAQELTDPLMSEDEEALVPHIMGEAYFLRALAYFDLARVYAQPYTYDIQSPGVPVVTVPDVSASPARATVAEVYTQIESDLDAAIDRLDFEPRSTSGSAAAYADKYAAYALRAKVALYMGDWQNAADYADMVIESGEFSLYTAANYLTIWGIDEQSETIFEVYGWASVSYAPYKEEIGYILDPNGYGDICATDDLINIFEAGDIRGQVFYDYPDLPTYKWSLKYPGKRSASEENNIPVLRLSEMYLIRAEAILNGASGAGYDALNDYNTIRTNRGLAAAGAVTLSDIYNERRRELCFEGNQVWDLSRTGRSLNRSDDGFQVTFPDYRWVLPFPEDEILNNVNLEQNTGY